MTCAACLSSAAGCAAHREFAMHVSPVDLTGRRFAALVERDFTVWAMRDGGGASITLVMPARPGPVTQTFDAPTLPEVMSLAWAWACTHDPMLDGLGLVLAAS